VGKLFLAFAPELVAAPEGPLERFTEHTAVDPAELEREIELARERGFAENREEWIPGLAVVAAPVSSAGRLVGAIAVAAPAPRLEALGRAQVARRTREAAARVAARLEGSSR
jgi:DNA-binding IclR family transcriptional regulator